MCVCVCTRISVCLYRPSYVPLLLKVHLNKNTCKEQLAIGIVDSMPQGTVAMASKNKQQTRDKHSTPRGPCGVNARRATILQYQQVDYQDFRLHNPRTRQYPIPTAMMTLTKELTR